MDSEEISEMMRVIAAHDPTLAEALKRHVFTFDDLSQLQAQTLSRIFDRLPPDRTVVALHGATAELRTTVLGALPARTRRLVESEIDNSAEPSTREVQRAKAEITRIALEMVKGEEISLGR
jgi:flagellar motor switch protein FliG